MPPRGGGGVRGGDGAPPCTPHGGWGAPGAAALEVARAASQVAAPPLANRAAGDLRAPGLAMLKAPRDVESASRAYSLLLACASFHELGKETFCLPPKTLDQVGS